MEPVPGRSSIYRCLVRHGLIVPEARKRTRSALNAMANDNTRCCVRQIVTPRRVNVRGRGHDSRS